MKFKKLATTDLTATRSKSYSRYYTVLGKNIFLAKNSRKRKKQSRKIKKKRKTSHKYCRGDVGPMKQKVSLGRWRDRFLCILLHTCLLYSLQWYVL